MIVAVAAGMVAGILSYGSGGLLWALAAYIGAGVAAVFLLAMWQALVLSFDRNSGDDRRSRGAARGHPAKN